METIRLVITILFCCQFSSTSEQMCPRGHRLQTSVSGLDVCVQCEEGINFMPTEGHSNKNCYNCTQIENPDVEILGKSCNMYHDSEILCQQGYYRYKARRNRDKDKCEKCTECKNLLRVCREYHDAVCCPAGQVAVVVRNGVTFCQKRPTVCGPGQHVNATAGACLPCPSGTYMFESNHTHASCFPCEAHTDDPTFYSVVIQECNITSPTVFGCQNGYFRSILHEPLTLQVKCSPCRKCQREITQCDMYHDAICYGDDHATQETVVVLESKSQVQIQEYSQFSTTQTVNMCASGHYLHINASDDSSSCRPCDQIQPEAISHTRFFNQTLPDQASICQPKIQKYQIYSIILFILAVLIDILFIFLYSRHFLKKTSNFPRRNSTGKSDKISHVFATIAMDVHFVLTFIHLFGILCEAGVISMEGDILWTFTVAVVVMSLLVYSTDIAIFLYVKQIVTLPACFHRRRHNTKCNINSGNYDDDDVDGNDDNLAIIESEVI